jgi:hypothetical protein
MANDRNTFAKRQREMEKKRKAGEKLQKRSQRRDTTQPEEPSAIAAKVADTRPLLSDGECKVLNVFREFMMSPGKMLCLNKADVELYSKSLITLIGKRFLVPEKFSGGYSLTQAGFNAMREYA